MKKHDLCSRCLMLTGSNGKCFVCGGTPREEALESMARLSLLLSDGRKTVQPDPLRELVAAAREAYLSPEGQIDIRLGKALWALDDLEV